MKRGNPIVPSLVALLILFGIWNCSGGGGSAAPGGSVGGGSINQAMPGMDEVPLGPTVDRNPRSVYLTCEGLPTYEAVQADNFQIVDDKPEYAAVQGPYRVKMVFLVGPVDRVVRVIDRNHQTYRQLEIKNAVASLKWDENQPQPLADVFLLPKGSTETNEEFQACPDGACHDAMMEKKYPCLLDNTCRFRGWNFPDCPLIDLN